MADEESRERARQLAQEAITLCERLGYGVAAAHLQLGCDLIGEAGPAHLREERLPWGSEEPGGS